MIACRTKIANLKQVNNRVISMLGEKYGENYVSD